MTVTPVFLRKTVTVILAALVILSILPYFIPISQAIPIDKPPFANSSFYLVDGISLHYRLWLPIAEPQPKGKILLVHGLGGSTFSWRKNIGTLTDAGYIVVAADLPGFGYSDRQSGMNHSQEQRSYLLWELLNKVDHDLQQLNYNQLSSRWTLIGHSMGGGTVTSMALQNPDKTNAIIFVNPAFLMNNNRSTILLKYLPASRWLKVLLRHVFLKEERISAFLADAYGRTPTKDEVEGYLNPLQLPGTEGALIDFAITSTSTTPSELKQIKTPVGAIWGELDSWVPVKNAEKLKEPLPDMQLYIIQGSYHCPMETDADVFNEYLLFLLNSFKSQ